MRLLEVASLFTVGPPRLKEFFGSQIPPYAILSHRWGDQEVTYLDVTDEQVFWRDRIYDKEGYVKIQKAADCAAAEEVGCEWIWSDTCCIDKRNSAELSEAINSMYAWYKNAKICFAYLVDWPSQELSSFTESVWFTRCWTLQELIAPTKLVFFDRSWEPVGRKMDVVDQIATRTRINKGVLLGERGLDEFSLAQRMSWSAGRVATRSEDEAYCLLGLFDINMPMLYGEGNKAFVRLQEEIMRRSADQSIFVWSSERPSRNLFAMSPSHFANSGEVRQKPGFGIPFSLNNLGVDIEVEMRQIRCNTYAAYLACHNGPDWYPTNLILQYFPGTAFFCRTGSCLRLEREKHHREVRKRVKVTILRSVPNSYLMLNSLYGFRLGGRCRSFVFINDWDLMHYWDTGSWKLEDEVGPSSTPVFRSPDNEAPSIATMVLFLGKERLLVQLMYDFEFNPCCYISKQNPSSAELFDFRSSWADRSEELTTWIDQDSSWTKSDRYQEIENTNLYTGQRAWAAKSVSRGEFVVQIPTWITKPYTNVEISFTWQPRTYDWVFDVHPAGTTPYWDLRCPILPYGRVLKDYLAKYSHLGTRP